LVNGINPTSSFYPEPSIATMEKIIAIVQSNYIPWKGYFDFINRVDEFILFDDVQYTRRDWRNRNKIKTPQGLSWLTIPVNVKGKYLQLIKDTLVNEPDKWPEKHWNSLRHAYGKTDCFSQYESLVQGLYEQAAKETHLSQINRMFIEAINKELKITTKISWSSDYEVVEGKNERLIELCKQAGGTHYISGPAAKSYIEEEMFAEAGLKLSWMEYGNYSEYAQAHPPFEHGVTVLDLLFTVGKEAPRFMNTFDHSLD